MATEASWIDTKPPLSGCWYLSHYADTDGQPTDIGDLADQARPPWHNPGSPMLAHKLGSLMGQAASLVATTRPYPLTGVKLVVPVPTYPPEHPRSLPEILAMYLAGGVGATCDNTLVSKTLETPNLLTADEMHRFASKAYRVNRALHGERILLVDDRIRSGETLRTIAELLVDAGAGEIAAFVVTKAEPEAGVFRRPA
jgi:predicted amidophosphoribosyltransferase